MFIKCCVGGTSGASCLLSLTRKVTFSAVILALIASLSACSWVGDSGKRQKFSKRVVELGQPVPKGGGRYKIGDPYSINGQQFYPREDRQYDRVGIASWYGELFHGRYTANGEIYDMNALSAAHPTLPMPVYAHVTNLENGRSLIVRINDRGPYAHDRVIDLSKRSAELLGFKRRGTARVRVRYVGKAPLNGNDRYERQYLAGQPWLRGAPYRRDLASRGNNYRNLIVGNVRQTGRVFRSPYNRPGPRYYVQTGSFKHRGVAERQKARLAHIARTSIVPVRIAGTTFYRVRLGPLFSAEAARRKLSYVSRQGINGAWISMN